MKKAFFLICFLFCLSLPAYADTTAQRDAQLTSLKAKAEQGDLKSQAALAYFYANTQNYDEALKLARPLADFTYKDNTYLANLRAQLLLGEMYEKGQGVPMDYLEAAKWYGLADALSGPMGDYTKSRFERVSQRLTPEQLAAVQEQIHALTPPGIIERQNKSRKTLDDLMTHLKEQAERGDASSQSTLGRTYAYGTGVAKDWQEAEKWYRKCAENGFADCHAGIGGLYRYGGPNLKQDWQEAFFWYSLAANSKVHDPQYPADRDEVSKHLTAEQVAAVNNRVAEWEKAHPAPASKP